MTQQFDITAGPSREELFDALRLRHEGRTVTVTVKYVYKVMGQTTVAPRSIEVTVDSIGVEDGSGNNWLLTLSDKNGSGRHEAYFNTTRREGWIRALIDE